MKPLKVCVMLELNKDAASEMLQTKPLTIISCLRVSPLKEETAGVGWSPEKSTSQRSSHHPPSKDDITAVHTSVGLCVRGHLADVFVVSSLSWLSWPQCVCDRYWETRGGGPPVIFQQLFPLCSCIAADRTLQIMLIAATTVCVWQSKGIPAQRRSETQQRVERNSTSITMDIISTEKTVYCGMQVMCRSVGKAYSCVYVSTFIPLISQIKAYTLSHVSTWGRYKIVIVYSKDYCFYVNTLCSASSFHRYPSCTSLHILTVVCLVYINLISYSNSAIVCK